MIKPVPYIGEPASLPLSVIISEQQIRTRNGFDEGSLSELAASIASVGLIEPIIVRPAPDQQGKYIVIAGERRLIAADMAGLAEAPVIIRDVAEPDARIIQAIENLQRENLTLADTAEGVANLLAAYKTPAALAKALGKSQPWVSKHLSLSKLKGTVKTAMDAGMTEDAELLLSLETLRKKDSDAFAKQIEGLEAGTTTRATVRAALAAAKKGKPTEPETSDDELDDEDSESDADSSTSSQPAPTIKLALDQDEAEVLGVMLRRFISSADISPSQASIAERILNRM